MEVIIADTSCLILFTKIDSLYILRDTYPSLCVTEQVAKEFGPLPNWISCASITNSAKFTQLQEELGDGEASSIALALENPDMYKLIIDEKKGRRIARENGVSIIGSIGTLLIAKQKGVIPSVQKILLLIEKTNFRISAKLKQTLLKQANEIG